MREQQCNCDLRTKLVGDGCQYCNPELAAELSKQEEEPLIPHQEFTNE